MKWSNGLSEHCALRGLTPSLKLCFLQNRVLDKKEEGKAMKCKKINESITVQSSRCLSNHPPITIYQSFLLFRTRFRFLFSIDRKPVPVTVINPWIQQKLLRLYTGVILPGIKKQWYPLCGFSQRRSASLDAMDVVRLLSECHVLCSMSCNSGFVVDVHDAFT